MKLGGNQCDDGNTKDGDGCDHNCNLEVGWSCQSTTPGGCDKCFPICQDGLVLGWEECDDGGIPTKGNGDGCSTDCKVEKGFQCFTTPGQPSVCTPVCGDKLTVKGEQCDDGNLFNGDG